MFESESCEGLCMPLVTLLATGNLLVASARRVFYLCIRGM